MLDARGYAAAVRLLRALMLFKLGFWTGTSMFGGIAVGAKTPAS